MKIIKEFLQTKQNHQTGTLYNVVRDIVRKKPQILTLAKNHETPFYLIDDLALQASIFEFETAFRTHIPESDFFYAIKTNYHPYLLKRVVKQGFGLDASSGRELEMALLAGAKEILFSGPGKTDLELKLAILHADKVILNIDNFSELDRVGQLLKGKKPTLRAGIRFFSSLHESWSKFGIPLKDLTLFWQKAKKINNLSLQGIQFHSSLNRYPDRNVKIISELGNYIQKEFPQNLLHEIKFIDLGGGYYPDKIEGYYPWSHSYPWTLSSGHFEKLAAEQLGREIKFTVPYYITRAATPNQFAKAIKSAITKHLSPIIKTRYFLEPGRIIATRAMHVVLRIVDVKKDLAITDGGLNMMGWEFGKEFYLPIVNLTNFSRKEIPFPLYGSLCTPRDLWGYSIYAKKVVAGDLIVIPNQGAYRFALAQTFIKTIPPVYLLK